MGPFGHAIEASIALNFGYSILVNFGRFSGMTIMRWGHAERLRVMAALAETKGFNKEVLDQGSARVYGVWIPAIRISNRVAIAAAVLSIMLAVLFLITSGFSPELALPGPKVFLMLAGIFGPVPLGLLVCLLLHGCARIHMRVISKQWDAAIKLVTNAPKQALEAGREALRTTSTTKLPLDDSEFGAPE